MKNSYLLLFLCLYITNYSQSNQNLIGTWELDYTIKDRIDCNGNPADYTKLKKEGRTVVKFIDSTNYSDQTWGFISNGTYFVRKDTLFFNAMGPDRIGLHFWLIEKMNEEQINISFVECDDKVRWTYIKRKRKKNHPTNSQ